MKAFDHALSISCDEHGPRFDLAVDLLLRQKKFVVLDGRIAFYQTTENIECEVISQWNSDGTQPQIFQREYEAAKVMFDASTLGKVLTGHKLRWSVVQDYGMGRSEVWHAG